ncbi:hypothetical protein RMS29_027140 (plasmid) [Agrobacterium rosae]|uniref:Uncharacterized protein n=1 Tax=Agrobacterium rosae TaxID=1972867 RepID=A0ABU4W3L7_9HYPH|nr:MULTISPECIES: hypothetical protein [Rhizobium/Agrobacterium group]MDX8332096.1 hypothetical protein [Agrobacterium rosae]WCJ66086.1 hypothetical protein G6M15_25035 [Agrobacterium tumefaciens]WCK17142.1 hypothetical protein G6L41_026690 [Agrobacterium tumefaciens]
MSDTTQSRSLQISPNHTVAFWRGLELNLNNPKQEDASVIQAQSAERPPFHVSHFRDNITVNLTVTSLLTSFVRDYDFDVTIGLTEFHCDSPGKVLVGGVVYIPTSGILGRDWKEDLLKSVWMSPVS